MSKVKELAKSSLSILASQVATTIISVVFLAYFARVFSLREMALFAFATVLSGWTLLIGSSGFGTLAIRDVVHMIAIGKGIEAKRLVSSIIVYRTAGIFLVTLLIYLVSDTITRLSFGDLEYASMMKFLVIMSFFMSSRAVLVEIQTAVQRFQSRSLLGTLTVLGQKVFCVIGYFIFGVRGFFAGFMIATIIGTIFTFLDIRQYVVLSLMNFRDVFRRSRGYMALDIMRGALDQIDRPVIAFFLGPESLAMYYMAKRLYDLCERAMRAIVDPIGIKFGEVKAEGIEKIKSYFKNSVGVAGYFFIPTGFFLMVISKPALLLYGGQKYAAAYPIAIAFGFSIMGAAMWKVYRELALRLVSARNMLLQYIISSITTLLCYVLLLPIIDAVGVPLATGFGYSFGIVPVWYQLRKRYELAFPAKEILLSFCIGLCILSLLIVPDFSNSVIRLILITIFSGVIYFAWMFLWGPYAVKLILRKIYLKIFSFISPTVSKN